MRYRRLGDGDLQISEISLGSWLTYGGGVGDSGKYRPGEPPPEGSRATHARMGRMMGRWLTDDVLEQANRLAPIAERLGISLPQLALAWILREPNVASAIVGATRPEQVRENASASGIELDSATLAEIEKAVGR